MKIIKILSAISFMIILSIVFVQCDKEEKLHTADLTSQLNASQTGAKMSDQEGQTSGMELNPCLIDTTDAIEDTLENFYIYPGDPTQCPLSARILYKRDLNTFQFFAFELIIPESCTWLTNHINSLSPLAKANFMKYLLEQTEYKGQMKIMQHWSDQFPQFSVVKAEIFHMLCRKLCVEYRLTKPGDPPRPLNGNSSGLRGGGGNAYYFWVRCGLGCCVTKIEYRRRDGDLEFFDGNTEPSGSCENGPATNIDGFKGSSCYETVKPCQYECSDPTGL